MFLADGMHEFNVMVYDHNLTEKPELRNSVVDTYFTFLYQNHYAPMPFGRRFYTTQDILNAITKCVEVIHELDCTGEEFDKQSDHIYRLIEKLIYSCQGKIGNARKVLAAQGLDCYLDIYIDLNAEVN